MSWLYTLTSALVLLAAASVHNATAQTLESAVMPGPVVAGHAKLENSCDKCHVRFDRGAQNGLCLACHKPVAADVRAGTGYHGRRRAQECRACHGEHRGRNADIVRLVAADFDHAATDFPLRGKHRNRPCADCHRAKTKYAQAASACVDCHRQDDRDKGHDGGLGGKCADCHDENAWKPTRFDHAKTKFALRLAHAQAKLKCSGCHRANRYVDTPRDCVSCHRQDDDDKGHRGRFGPRCERCHGEGDWKAPAFRHDRDTHFPLLDRHRSVKCEHCHRSPLYRDKTPTRCYACHRPDDEAKGHRAALGEKCEQCHDARSWKESRFAHDRDTKFPLRAKHLAANCRTCHKPGRPGEKLPLACVGCHRGEDNDKGHKGRFGPKCEACHNERSFKPADFDHGRDAKFVLTGRHLPLACDACHRDPLYAGKSESRCHVCHKKDDVHFGSFDLQCGKCHLADNWRKIVRGQLP